MLFLLAVALASPPPTLQSALTSTDALAEVPRGLRIVAVSKEFSMTSEASPTMSAVR